MAAEDVVFLASPLTFDPSVVELFLSLSSGACLLIVPTVIKKVPDRLAVVLFQRHRITVLQVSHRGESDRQLRDSVQISVWNRKMCIIAVFV